MVNVYVAQVGKKDEYAFLCSDSSLVGDLDWLFTDLDNLKEDLYSFIKNINLEAKNIAFYNLCDDLKIIFSEDVKAELRDVNDEFLENLERLVL